MMHTIKCFLSFVLLGSILIQSVWAQDQTKEIKKLYSKICGDYEFYIEERYITLKMYLKDGQLMGVEPGDDPVKFELLDLNRLEFQVEDKGKKHQVRFLSDPNGMITGCFWKTDKKEFQALRVKKVPIPERFTVEVLRQDLLQMKEAMARIHPALYEFTNKATFDQLFDQQLNRIDKPLTMTEFYCLAAPLVTRIGCGHSSLQHPDYFWKTVSRKRIPLRLRFVDDKAYLIEVVGDAGSIPPGSEIVTINEEQMSQIIENLKSVLSSDGFNDSYRVAKLNMNFPFIYAPYYGFPDEFTVTYKRPGQRISTKTTVKAVDMDAVEKAINWKPILDFKVKEEKNTAIIAINSFVYYRKKDKFFSFIDDVFAEIQEKNIKNLILDFRGNFGGDPFCATHLLSYIASTPVPYFAEPYGKYAELAAPIPLKENRFSGNLFILTDGWCFSTTGHLCSLLRYHRVGTFVGAETGGTYTCNDAKRVVHLKNTRFGVQLARKSFATAVQGLPNNRGIIPDHPVELRIEDLIAGKDTVMDFMLNLILRKDNNESADENE